MHIQGHKWEIAFINCCSIVKSTVIDIIFVYLGRRFYNIWLEAKRDFDFDYQSQNNFLTGMRIPLEIPYNDNFQRVVLTLLFFSRIIWCLIMMLISILLFPLQFKPSFKLSFAYVWHTSIRQLFQELKS